MGLKKIGIKEAEDYEEYDAGKSTDTNKWSFKRVKYFSSEPGDDGWDKVTYYYGLKSDIGESE